MILSRTKLPTRMLPWPTAHEALSLSVQTVNDKAMLNGPTNRHVDDRGAGELNFRV